MSTASVASLARLVHLEGACEAAVTRLILAAGRCIDEPSPGAWLRHDAFREKLVNQCDRLAFLLLRTPAHREYRARYLADFARLFEEWPDLFTEPEVFPSLRRLVALWNTTGSARPDPPGRLNRGGELEGLLRSLFADARDLRRWLAGYDEFDPIHADLPGTGASLTEFVHEFRNLAERHGLLDAAFFAALKASRPRRSDEIAAVEQRWRMCE